MSRDTTSLASLSPTRYLGILYCKLSPDNNINSRLNFWVIVTKSKGDELIWYYLKGVNKLFASVIF